MTPEEKLAELGAALQNEHRLEGEIILLKTQLARAIEALRPFAEHGLAVTSIEIHRAADVYKELIHS